MKTHSRLPFLGALLVLVLLQLDCDKSMPTEPAGARTNPAWLDTLIAQIQSEPVTTPPSAIYSYRYRNETVYFRISRCCDQRSILYDANGMVLCEPDGGIDSGGDGRCPDFLSTRTDERLIFRDPRT
ncbi:MAG TPA: hypothetical protein VGH97_04185 [Thermoanaerobaculia bacterium]|jgi:hypothetical protein